MHANIRSVHNNFELLHHELIHLFDYRPDVICLSETKLKDAPLTNIFLTDYEPIIHANSVTNTDSVGVYVCHTSFVIILSYGDIVVSALK